MAKKGKPKTNVEVEVDCKTCGTHFTVPHWKIKQGGGKYCSLRCYWDSMQGQPSRRGRVEPEERHCENCGKGFLVGGEHRPKRVQRYCSRECVHEATSTQPTPNSLELQWVTWLAGVFDGEGSIVFAKKRPAKNVRISVHNTCYEFIERIYELVGTGTIIALGKYKTQAHHKDQWVWQCYGENARNLLRQMYPHLIVKKERADLALSAKGEL